MKVKTFFGVICLILIMAVPAGAFAAGSLEWDPPSTGTVNGYKIYYGGTQGGPYSNSQDVGAVTSYGLSNLPLQEMNTYYFVVRAYNDAGESENSNEVSLLVPDTTPPAAPQGVTVQ